MTDPIWLEIRKWTGDYALIFAGALALFWFAIRKKVHVQVEVEIEEHKKTLERIAQDAQYEIQKEILKAQYVRPKLMEAYSVIYEIICKAEGAASQHIGLNSVPTWQQHTVDEIQTMLHERKVPGEMVATLIAGIRRDAAAGKRALFDYLMDWRRIESQEVVRQANNEIILRSLFLSDEARELAHGIVKNLELCLIDIDPEIRRHDREAMRRAQGSLTLASAKIPMLLALMKKELNPR